MMFTASAREKNFVISLISVMVWTTSARYNLVFLCLIAIYIYSILAYGGWKKVVLHFFMSKMLNSKRVSG